MAWLNPLATAAIPSSQSGPIVPPGGAAGNILVLDGTGQHASDSGVSLGTDFDQIPNCAQVSGMISEELLNAPTLPAVDAATTGPLASMSGEQSVDNVALTAGKFCLVKNEAAESKNSVYLVALGAWSRCYYTGTAWAPLTAAQTTYDDLDIDNGIIQVKGGTLNGNTSYRCAVSDTSKLLTDATASVSFSRTTLAPIPDVCNRHVSINNGNDTSNEGTPDFPHQRIGRALQGMAFPGVIKVAVSGATYNEAVAIPAAATALTIEAAGDDSRGSGVRWTQPWTITYPDAAGFLTLRGMTWSTGAANPFSFPVASGKAAMLMVENCAFSGTMADVTPAPSDYTGTLALRNINLTAAPNASIAIRFGAGTYQFSDQQSPVPITITGGGTGALATINIDASCNPGAVRVPLNFLGKINRYQPVPTRLVSVITTQAALDALIANKAAASSGFYLLNGFVPTQNAALAGGIIGHYADGSAAVNWWERSFADSPGAVDVGGQPYVKAAGSSWVVLQTPGTFLWWANQLGSPLAGWPVNATLAGNAHLVNNYVQFTAGGAQGGTVIWNLAGVDWSRDITCKFNVFFDASADGISFNFGGSSAMTVGGSNTPQNTANGGITVRMTTYATLRGLYVLNNGAQIFSVAPGSYPSGWAWIEFRIRNWGSKRLLSVYINDTWYAVVDISAWTLAGGYFSVGGGTGGAGTNHAMSSVEARYV